MTTGAKDRQPGDRYETPTCFGKYPMLFLMIFLSYMGSSCVAQEIPPVSDPPSIISESIYRRLAYAGFEPGEYRPEGSKAFTEAVKRFQAFAGLDDTGIPDPQTVDKIMMLYDPLEKRDDSPVEAKASTPEKTHPESDASNTSTPMKSKEPAETITTGRKTSGNGDRNEGGLEDSRSPSPLESNKEQWIADRIDPERIDFSDYPLAVGDTAYAVDKYECSDISGDWAVYYLGTVTEITGDHVSIQLSKRYSYRYRPGKTGVDDSHWWCSPLRRHCYSEVRFTAWGGDKPENSVVPFTPENVYNTKIGVVNALFSFVQRQCRR